MEGPPSRKPPASGLPALNSGLRETRQNIEIVWWRRRESFFSTGFRMCKLLIVQGHKIPKVPHSRVHRTPIVHGVGEHKANLRPDPSNSQR